MKRRPHDALLLFTRLPVPGHAKTRLIPRLGPEGAAEFQRRMTRHAVGRAWAYAKAAPRCRLRIAYDGASAAGMSAWLGRLRYRPQGGGTLGDRLFRSIEEEFSKGARRVVVVGADCPRIDETTIAGAFEALSTSPVIFGPARDGGYYLVGMSRPVAELFDDIPWGTDQVLHRSLERAGSLGIDAALLSPLPDVDVAQDLPDAMEELHRGRSVSVIVPALDEAANLERLLPLLRAGQPLEIIVADGGSTDATVPVAERHGARVVRAPRGRGAQMNAAAKLAAGEYLLFLHADTCPPPDFCRIVADHLEPAGVAAGAFRFALLDSIRGGALIEQLVHLRCSIKKTPYGDQGLFVRRSLFHAVAGFPEWPILEDIELVRRLRRIGRVVVAPETAPTSARRWKSDGVCRTFFRHQLILLGHTARISAESLWRWR